MIIKRFSAIFDGLHEAYGTYVVNKQQANGKNTGKAAILREPRTTKLWEGHLSGKGNSIGIIPGICEIFSILSFIAEPFKVKAPNDL